MVRQSAVLSAWQILPTLQLLPKLSCIQARLYVNLVCVHCQCFEMNVHRSVVCPGLGKSWLLTVVTRWMHTCLGGVEPSVAEGARGSLAVQRVGPVLPHQLIPVGVELCVGAVMGGLLLQEQALYKCLRAANCSNQFKWWHLSSHVYQ